jgi:hypothetical protein
VPGSITRMVACRRMTSRSASTGDHTTSPSPDEPAPSELARSRVDSTTVTSRGVTGARGGPVAFGSETTMSRRQCQRPINATPTSATGQSTATETSSHGGLARWCVAIVASLAAASGDSGSTVVGAGSASVGVTTIATCESTPGDRTPGVRETRSSDRRALPTRRSGDVDAHHLWPHVQQPLALLCQQRGGVCDPDVSRWVGRA